MDSGPPSSSSAGNTDHSDGSSIHDHGTGSLLEAAGIAGCVWMHADGTITDANDAFVSLTGYSRLSCVEPRFPRSSRTISRRSSHSLPMTRRVQSRRRFRSEPVRETRRSIEIHLERVATDGDESRVVGLVNRRATSTKSVSSSEFTYGRTFPGARRRPPDGIIVLDTNSDIQYANPAVERILGYTPGELVGSSKITIIPPAFDRPTSTRCNGISRPGNEK